MTDLQRGWGWGWEREKQWWQRCEESFLFFFFLFSNTNKPFCLNEKNYYYYYYSDYLSFLLSLILWLFLIHVQERRWKKKRKRSAPFICINKIKEKEIPFFTLRPTAWSFSFARGTQRCHPLRWPSRAESHPGDPPLTARRSSPLQQSKFQSRPARTRNDRFAGSWRGDLKQNK